MAGRHDMRREIRVLELVILNKTNQSVLTFLCNAQESTCLYGHSTGITEKHIIQREKQQNLTNEKPDHENNQNAFSCA